MKAFSDLEQSKKLAEILPIESADMYYPWYIEEDGDTIENGHRITTPNVGNFTTHKVNKMILPCWSLAALIGVLPSRLFDSTPKRKELYLLPDLDKSYCFYRQFAVKTKGKIYLLTEGECLVDACYEMIIKLHELNLL